MRRVISAILFVLGGWMLGGELMVAFLDMELGLADNFFMIGLFIPFALVPLLLGAWASPGRRWRELGLTILIVAGFTMFSGVTMAVMLTDPQFLRYMPPTPNVHFMPLFGALNLVVVSAVGWLLYRQPAEPVNETAG